MPGSHNRNPGSSIQEEVGEREVQTFQLWKKTESQTWGENALKKNRVPTFHRLCFFSELEKNRVKEMWGLCFFHSISPYVWDSVFIRSLKVISPLLTPSWNFSGPRFWILTKGVIRQPVRGLPCPNSVIGMEQPNPDPSPLIFQQQKAS